MNITEMSIGLTQEADAKHLLRACYEHAQQSNHPSTHNAALLVEKSNVVLQGLNVLPPGVLALPKRFEGEAKHWYLNHAERAVIYDAARKGIKTEGLMMVMPWLPCIPCANAIITSGVASLLVHKQMIEKTSDRWKEELKNAVKILQEAGVTIRAYDGKVGVQAFMHGESWEA